MITKITSLSELPEAGNMLLKATASWCSPCKAMQPALEKAAIDLNEFAIFSVAEFDIDDSPDIAKHFGIRSVPTLIVLHEGKEIARQSGAIGKDAILQLVKSSIRPTEMVEGCCNCGHKHGSQ